jgi:tRNA 2-thiocytidine biosynthesis protein TtcA
MTVRTPESAADPVRKPQVTALRSDRELEEDGFLPDSDVHIRIPARPLIPDDPNNMERRLSHLFTKASKDFGMLEAGDKVMVCMSGGKDSYALLHLMQRAQKHSPHKFEIVAVHLDQGHPGFPTHILEDHLKASGAPYEIVHQHTYQIVLDKLEPGKTTCSLCSRLRRGILYDTAQRLGCTKIALGHHRDDILATLLLNLFFCGTLKAMPPLLRADDGKNVVIRPMAYIPENFLIKWSEMQQYPVIPCSLCSRQPDLKRSQMQNLLKDLDRVYPGALPSALKAVTDVKPRFLLDRKIFDFTSFQAGAEDREEDAFA